MRGWGLLVVGFPRPVHEPQIAGVLFDGLRLYLGFLHQSWTKAGTLYL